MSEQDFPDVAPSSRMKYLALPFIHPGKCACCGSIERPVVDFGMTLDFYGAVMLCVTCLAEAGRIVGLVPVEELQLAQESLAQSIDENLRSAGKVAITNEQQRSLIVAVRGLSDLVLSFDPSGDAVVNGPTAEAEPNLFETVIGTDRELQDSEPSESGTPEQVFDFAFSEGSDELSGNSRDGNTSFSL